MPAAHTADTFGAISASSFFSASTSISGRPKPLAQRIVVRGQALDLPRNRFRIGEVSDANGAAANLIFVRRADATLGCADGRVTRLVLARGVEIAVERQNERGLIGEHQQISA
jgi:hypothetical protein